MYPYAVDEAASPPQVESRSATTLHVLAAGLACGGQLMRTKHPWVGFTVSLVFAGFTALSNAQQSTANQPAQYIDRTYPVPAGNRLPDKNAQMSMKEKLARKKDLEAANLERKRQIDNDSAELLEAAKELKDAVDGSGGDALSVDVLRKAEQMERLAHGIKEKMKLSVNGG